jgi:glycosyltransferase involved in cell wall biosynthesis
MFCSTIIPTINRSTLSRAVCSVLDQSFKAADFEVIVVNDSGQPLTSMEWQMSDRVRVITTNRRERSIARNTGAAIAKGRYLHFLDDDDWLLPGALDTFWTLSQSTDAIWLYGGYQAVNDEGVLIMEERPDISGNIFAHLVAGEGMPLGASIFQSDVFFKVGMFDPYYVEEVLDLYRRIACVGDVARSLKLVASFRVGQQGSTTDWPLLPEYNRRGREKALRLPEAFSRLRASATSSYWRGRVSRAYFASMVWNMQHKDFVTAISRGIAAVAIANGRIISAGYWRGLRSKIKPLGNR